MNDEAIATATAAGGLACALIVSLTAGVVLAAGAVDNRPRSAAQPRQPVVAEAPVVGNLAQLQSPLLTDPLRAVLTPAPPTDTVAPARPEPPEARIIQTGRITYYGKRFAGRKTASGEIFDPEAMTMAHRTLPFGTRVRVTNLRNGESVILRVNDRMPGTRGRIADVSEGAARRLGMIDAGVVEGRIEVLRVMRTR